MKRGLTTLLAFLALPASALAQGALLQGGQFASGHVPMYIGQGSSQPVVGDSGPASGGGNGVGLKELALAARGTGAAPFANAGTGPFGANMCDYDGPTTSAAGYHFLCFSANAQGGGLIAYGAGGIASQLPLIMNINGTAYDFPFAISGTGIIGPNPTVIGDLMAFNNTNGTLAKDTGINITGAGTTAAMQLGGIGIGIAPSLPSVALNVVGNSLYQQSFVNPSTEQIADYHVTNYNLTSGDNSNDGLSVQGLMVVNPGAFHLTSQHTSGILGYCYGADASWAGTVDHCSGVIGGAGNLGTSSGVVTLAAAFLARPTFTGGPVTNFYAFYDQNGTGSCGATNCYGAAFGNPVQIGNNGNAPTAGYTLDVTGRIRNFDIFTSGAAIREAVTGLYTYTLASGTSNDGFGEHIDFSINPSGFTGTAQLSGGIYSVSYGNGAGTVQNVNGVVGQAGNQGSGTVTIASAITAGAALNSGGGVLTSYYAFRDLTPLGCSSLATNCYGGTFANLVGFGTASPTTMVDVHGTFRVLQASPGASDACQAGQIVADAGFIYTCASSGTWKRVAVTGGY